MRVVTWNVRSLRDSRADVVAVLRSLDPDVVCVQEAPRFVLPRWRASRLARDCGLVVASAGRPTAGVAILVRPSVRVVAARRTPLPWTPPRHRRGIAQALVEVDGAPVAVASLHLGLVGEERLRHADEVAALLGSMRTPSILAGDLNEEPAGPVWEVFAHYQDAWALAGTGDGRTFPAASPRRRIDAVLVDRRLVVLAASVGSDEPVRRASDHRPVVVDVAWPTDT